MNFKTYIFASGICIVGFIAAFFVSIFHTNSYEVEQGDKPVTNPLKGWVTSADGTESEQEASLAFVLIKWSELEPKEGNYDFASLEKKNNFDDWRKKGVRLVLRVVCDYPEEEKGNITIPNWLYKKTGKAGDWYDNSYGIGFSPDYSNEIFMEAHKNLIKALGDRYNKDELVAFIQLGSIGHWGEWHVNHNEGIRTLPKSDITDQYVAHYLTYLPDKIIMMRRPYGIAGKHEFGLFNDSLADEESTADWLSWIAKGYTSEQNREKFAGMPDYWKKAPSGGEISSYESLDTYFSEYFVKTYNQVIKSHTTFVGPNCPVDLKAQGTLQKNINKMSADMGYCYTVSKYRISDFGTNVLNLTMTWENIGIAPMYQNWPLEVSLVDESGKVCAVDYPETDITKWLPGKTEVECVLKAGTNFINGTYRICVAILDPVTRKPAVKLALKDELVNSTYVIGKYIKKD